MARTAHSYGCLEEPTFRAHRASRWRSGGLLALLAASSACIASSEPSTPPEGGDSSVHADAGVTVDDAGKGLDADVADASRPDLDARSTDANELIDARASLDAAALDSGFYFTEDGGRCFFPVSNACAPRRAPDVRCGTSVCSGATPVCCGQGWSEHIPPVCVAEGALCIGSADGGSPWEASSNLLDHCDETSDCKADEICLDGRSKGPTPRSGGRCSPSCFPPAFGFSAYRYQLCANDCECVNGQGCVNGVCAYR